jgi:ABC-type taurine transport system ATPase subunit
MNSQPLLSPALSRSQTSDSSLVLEVSGLAKVYRSRVRRITAFEKIAFSLYRGEIAVILGPSGCGKSSFLKTVAGLEPATRGSVRALDQTVSAPIPQFGFVFQQPVLFPWLNVRQNVGFALALKSGPQLQKKRRNQAIDAALSDVGLSGTRLGATALSNPMKHFSGIEELRLTGKRVSGGYRINGSLPWVSNLASDTVFACIPLQNTRVPSCVYV